VGIALTITFLGDRFLSIAGKYTHHLHRAVIAVAFLTTLTAMMFLAVIRGHLLTGWRPAILLQSSEVPILTFLEGIIWVKH
jgi:putative Ca2+/H+ antiporter (TMEM165/GDT1 family)